MAAIPVVFVLLNLVLIALFIWLAVTLVLSVKQIAECQEQLTKSHQQIALSLSNLEKYSTRE